MPFSAAVNLPWDLLQLLGIGYHVLTDPFVIQVEECME